MDKCNSTWPEPGANVVHSRILPTKLNSTVCRSSTIMSIVCRRPSVWVSGASGVIQMFSLVLFVLWLTSKTLLCKNNSQTAMCGVTEATTQRRLSGWKVSLRSAGGGGFLCRPPDDAAAAQSCLTSFDHPHTSRPSSRLRLWRLHRATASCGNWEADEFPTTAAANQVTETKPQEVELLKTFWGVPANWLGVGLVSLIGPNNQMMNHSWLNVSFSFSFQKWLKMIYIHLMWRPLQHLNNLFHI